MHALLELFDMKADGLYVGKSTKVANVFLLHSTMCLSIFQLKIYFKFLVHVKYLK